MTKKTVIENRNTANTQPASIIMNSASQPQASPRRQSHHAEHIQSTAIMLAMRAVQSETMPPAMRFSTGHSVSQSFLFLREHTHHVSLSLPICMENIFG